jgi:glycosyltransferase involved in cell wall biosynthesis
LTVLLLDADSPPAEIIEHARVLGLEDVAGVSGGLLAAANPPDALAIAVLPLLFETLLGEGAESVIYLAAGQRVLGPLDELTDSLSEHQVLLVARLAADVRTRATFAEHRARGVFSRQVMGVRGGQAAKSLLSIWPRHFDDADGGAAAVGAWIDSLPALVEDLFVLRDPRYGADPWTLSQQPLDAVDEDAGIEGRPLLTFDFSEMTPRDPLSLCDEADGVDLSSAPALARLCVRHADDLIAAGFGRDAVDPAPPFARLEDGLLLKPTIRRMLVEGVESGVLSESPFTDAGRRALLDYLASPSDRGKAFGLTRLHMAIWDARSDLRSAYPHIDGPDGAAFAGWLCRYGEEQEGLTASLLPPVPDLAFRDADPLIHEDPPRWGVNVAGFFTSELGVGEAARLLIAGLDAVGIPVLPVQGHLLPPSRQGVEFAFAGPDEAAYPINLICINGDGIPVFAREAGRSFFDGRYTIAAWWWEVGEPSGWERAFEYVDEVWVTSQHVHDLIAPISPVPVVKMTMPVLMPNVVAASRSELGLPEEGFLFLFVHDYHSVESRKNPVAPIEAFKRAFPPGSGAKLAIKSINGSKLPNDHARVVLAASDHPDITLIDGYVSAQEKNAMIADCDCYISLHRAEGFGLTVAEAMLLGKPVIATRYGGTLEFTNDDNSYLVDWEPVIVGDKAGVYPAAATWAEPDLDAAAALMRHVFERQAEAQERGELARLQTTANHAPEVAGRDMEVRLRHIRERMADEGVRTLNLRHVPASEAGADYPDGLGTPPRINWGSGRLASLRSRAQRPLADWVHTYLEHQTSIDAKMFDRLASLDAQVREVARTISEQQQARHAETLAVLRQLQGELSDIQKDGLGKDPTNH